MLLLAVHDDIEKPTKNFGVKAGCIDTALPPTVETGVASSNCFMKSLELEVA